MRNNKQSSVEMMWDEIDNLIPYKDELQANIFRNLLEKYKEMHKEEIVDAYNESFILRDKPYSTAEKYYNKTFGGKNANN